MIQHFSLSTSSKEDDMMLVWLDKHKIKFTISWFKVSITIDASEEDMIMFKLKFGLKPYTQP